MASIRFIGSYDSQRPHLILEQDGQTYLLSSEALAHLISQHRDASVGSLFSSALSRDDGPDDGADARFGQRLMEMISSGLAMGGFKRQGACHEFQSAAPVGVDAAVFGAEPQAYALKEENRHGALVPAVFGEAPSTNILSAIIVPTTDRAYLPEDLKNNLRLNAALVSGRLHSALTAFPGVSTMPDGSPFPKSSQMIGSGVCLISKPEGCVRCPEEIAAQLNAVMATLDRPPSLTEVEDTARELSAIPAPAAPKSLYVCKAKHGAALHYPGETFTTASAAEAVEWAQNNYFYEISVRNQALGDKLLASTYWVGDSGQKYHHLANLDQDTLVNERPSIAGWDSVSGIDPAFDIAVSVAALARREAELKNKLALTQDGPGSVSFPLISPRKPASPAADGVLTEPEMIQAANAALESALSNAKGPPSVQGMREALTQTFEAGAELDREMDRQNGLREKLAQRRDPAPAPEPEQKPGLIARALSGLTKRS